MFYGILLGVGCAQAGNIAVVLYRLLFLGFMGWLMFLKLSIKCESNFFVKIVFLKREFCKEKMSFIFNVFMYNSCY